MVRRPGSEDPHQCERKFYLLRASFTDTSSTIKAEVEVE